MKSFLRTAACLTALAALSIFSSCSDDPAGVPLEQLGSFQITLPDSVTTGESFSITVRAVGDQGTSPFANFSGIVVLTASNGSCAPDSLQLTGGSGSGSIVLSGSVEDQTITATYGGITGSAKVNAGFMTVLVGDPADPANETIPDLAYFADGANFSNDHPNLGEMYVSFNTIMLSFNLGTTVETANTVLYGIGAKIVGGIPGDESVAPGVLFLKLPTTSHAEMAAVLASLDANPDVQVAVQDVLAGTNALPKPGGNPADWVWEDIPAGGNWGFEAMRVPQTWNFNDAVKKKIDKRGTYPPSVLIVDTGFKRWHEDLDLILARPIFEEDHGTHIAGTIGADYFNEKGVQGIAPYVTLYGKSVRVLATGNLFQDLESAGQAFIDATHHTLRPYHRVVNMSLGYNWDYVSVNSDTSSAAQELCARQAQEFVNTLHLAQARMRTPLFVVAAGNDGNMPSQTRQAKYSSPMCYAALEMGIESILVVEAAQVGAAGIPETWPFTSLGGHVSAPGWEITSTLKSVGYGSSIYGTSCAAAHVSGLAAYIFGVESYLTWAQVKDVIVSNASAIAGGAAPFVDAWASVVDIDRYRGGTPTLVMMCDIDDGSIDGNHRVDYPTGNLRDDDEDVDHDEGIGDGNVDMGDFRRWRDWYLATRPLDPVELNGAADHPKKDVNQNGKVGTPAEERLYPRGDFNGDGKLDVDAVSYVPGAVGGSATDLDVLRTVFDDPDYQESELPELIESGDIEVLLIDFISAYGATSATVKLWSQGAVKRTKVINISDPHAVITAKSLPQGYSITLEISGSEGSDVFSFDNEIIPLAPGDDFWMGPIKTIPVSPNRTFLHVCSDDQAGGAVIIDLNQMGIHPGQHIIIDQIGYYDAGGGWTHVEDMVAVFSSDDRLLSSNNLHRVPGAIDAGADYYTEGTFECDGEATDIPEDFQVNPHVTIQVPANAKNLFIGAEDSKLRDNSNTGGFAVQITRIWMKDL